MKLLISLIVLSLSFAVMADTRTFTYDGSQNSIAFQLQSEKTHTEYRLEQHRTTCYRTEVVGHRTHCTGGGSTGGPNPRPIPRQCWSEPVYRTVSYSCIQTIQVPYEVKDYDVQAQVLIDVSNLSNEVTSGENFKITLHGDSLALETLGSKKFFLVLKKQDLRSQMNGSVKFMNAFYAIELIHAQPVLKALKMTNISFKEPVLVFNMGLVSDMAQIGFALNIAHAPILGSNTTLFDRELVSTEVMVTNRGNSSEGGIDVNHLGVELKSGRHLMTAKAFFKHKDKVLNGSQFEDLEVSRTLIYKR